MIFIFTSLVSKNYVSVEHMVDFARSRRSTEANRQKSFREEPETKKENGGQNWLDG